MIKHWKVTAQLFWSAERIEKTIVKCHTARKAKIMATQYFTRKYPHIGSMIKILSVEEVW